MNSEIKLDKYKDSYEKNGFCVIKNLLPAKEALEWNQKCEKLAKDNGFSRNDTFAPANIARFEEFQSLILDPRLLETLDFIVGNKVCFTQQADIALNKDGGGWHRDSVDNKFGVGDDWNETTEKYDCVRVIFYLGDKDVEAEYLKVIPCSHRLNSFSFRSEYFIRQKFNYLLNRFKAFKFLGLPPRIEDWSSSLWMKTCTIKSKPGDCIVFTQKLFHLALRRKEYKSGIFLSYGSDTAHSRKLRGNFRFKENYVKSGYSDYPEDFEAKLKKMGRFVDATHVSG